MSASFISLSTRSISLNISNVYLCVTLYIFSKYTLFITSCLFLVRILLIYHPTEIYWLPYPPFLLIQTKILIDHQMRNIIQILTCWHSILIKQFTYIKQHCCSRRRAIYVATVSNIETRISAFMKILFAEIATERPNADIKFRHSFRFDFISQVCESLSAHKKFGSTVIAERLGKFKTTQLAESHGYLWRLLWLARKIVEMIKLISL